MEQKPLSVTSSTDNNSTLVGSNNRILNNEISISKSDSTDSFTSTTGYTTLNMNKISISKSDSTDSFTSTTGYTTY